eukprot:274208_1
MSLIIWVSTLLCSIQMHANNLSFAQLEQKFTTCPQYDIIDTYCMLEALNEQKEQHNSFENQISLDEFELIVRQISPDKYLSKANIIAITKMPHLSKKIDWIMEHFPLHVIEYTLQIGMTDTEITPMNIIGKICNYSDKIHKNDTVPHKVEGKMIKYNVQNNKHLLDLGYEKKWISVNSKRKHEQLDIVKKIETHQAIHPKTYIHFLNALGLLFTEDAENMGPNWSQFQNSMYGSRHDLKRALQFDIFCAEKSSCSKVSFTPMIGTIGDTFCLRNKDRIAVV